jgi:uncharacterized membrane protein HdeD (DUF308 family)
MLKKLSEKICVSVTTAILSSPLLVFAGTGTTEEADVDSFLTTTIGIFQKVGVVILVVGVFKLSQGIRSHQSEEMVDGVKWLLSGVVLAVGMTMAIGRI